MSHPIIRRRSLRACALGLAVACAALALPAAALADGQLDPAFNGTGFHVGTAGEGTLFNNVENRVPMVVQADGKIVAGGSRGGFLTLVRYNVNGTIDTTFGAGGFVSQQFSGTPAGQVGTSGAVAMTQDASGNIVVAGFGGSQSMVVARYTAAGVYNASAVCFAPHLIDFTARAVAVLSNGSIALAGYARDRHPAFAVPPGPQVLYSQHAVVTLPASGNSTTACGTYTATPDTHLSLGSDGVKMDGITANGTVTDATLGGRYFDAAVASGTGFVLATVSGPDGTAWVQRYDATGTATGTRTTLAASSVHALALAPDGSVLAAGESTDAAVSANRQMQVARIAASGALVAGYGTGGIARSRVGGGSDTGQAIVVNPDGSVIVGGSANVAGKTAFGLTRLTAAGVRDDIFGTHGETTTTFGTPAVNGYITGMALSGNLLAVAGRLTDANGLLATTARYYATGTPPPPPPPPAISTLAVDGVTGTSAHVTGTANARGTAATYYLEYGTSTSYGTKTPVESLAATTNDVNIGTQISGLALSTLYHARFVIVNSIATVPGDDITFTTASSGGPGAGALVTGKGAKRICKVPKVKGTKINKARRKVIAAGCKVKVVYKHSKRPKNVVLLQSRKANRKLVYNALIRLTVSTHAKPKKHS